MRLSNADYHAHPAIGAHGLMDFMISPAHYYAHYLDPAKENKAPRVAYQWGRAWHAAMFEPEAFASEYVVIPEGIDRRTKDGKALFAEIEASNRTPIATKDYAEIMRMVAVGKSSKTWRGYASLGEWVAEESLFYTDPETGVELKIRPDYSLNVANGIIIDGKTCADAGLAGFGAACWRYNYLLQAALYCDVWQAIHGNAEPPLWVWWAQEKEAPYAFRAYIMTPAQHEYGREQYRALLPEVKKCLDSGEWPGYIDEASPMELPAWAQKVIDGGEEIAEIAYKEDDSE